MKRMAEKFPNLIDPAALRGDGIGRLLVRGSVVADNLNERAAQVAAAPVDELRANVLIQARQVPSSAARARRTAPDVQVERLIATAESIRAQKYADPSRIMVAAMVDYPDFDPSMAQRNKLSDLRVQILNQDHRANVPESMNAGLRWMSSDHDGMAVLMNAGNRFATDQAMRAASLHLNDGATGAYGPRVMDRGASLFERVVTLNGDSNYYEQYNDVEKMPWASDNGFMAAEGAVFSGALLHDHPLDTAYGLGGAERQWATHFQEVPHDVVYDPAMAVHAANGMGFRGLLEEVQTHMGPTDYPNQ